jgi:predicted transposase YbfD/YdcC
VDEKSNEIVAIPKLLNMLSIEGAIVTIDATGRPGSALSCLFGDDDEVAKIGSLFRACFRPEYKQFAPILSGVRAMRLASLEMKRSASRVLLAFVGEVALRHIERLGHAFVEMGWNDRARLHTYVQHHWPQRVICISNCQRDLAFTGEGETIHLKLTIEYFLVNHDTASSCMLPLDLMTDKIAALSGGILW